MEPSVRSAYRALRRRAALRCEPVRGAAREPARASARDSARDSARVGRGTGAGADASSGAPCRGSPGRGGGTSYAGR